MVPGVVEQATLSQEHDLRSGLVALMATAAACSSPVSPRDDLRMETSLSATTIRPGEPVTISVIVTNDGKQIRRISTDYDVCPAPFVVIAGDGTSVRPWSLCTAALTPPKELAPGRSMTLTVEWSGDSQPGRAEGPESSMLPAGSYQLRGSIFVVGGGLLEGPPMELRIIR